MCIRDRPILFIGWWVLGRVRGDRRQILTLSLVLGLLIAGGGVYATHVEPRLLRVDQVVVSAPVPQPVRVGVIADLQSPAVGRIEEAAIARMLDQDPDLVLVPGDWFQGTSEQLEASRADFTSLLATLVARVGTVVVVSGDSDGASRLNPMAVDAGAIFLDSATTTVRVGTTELRIAGVPVAPSQARFETLQELRQPSDAFTILLAHRPDAVFDLDAGADVDLVVSGHTHGGQVSIPFLGPPVTFSDIPRDLAAGGLGVVDGFPVYVSTGVGLERLQAPQVRFGARPSIGVIDIMAG